MSSVVPRNSAKKNRSPWRRSASAKPQSRGALRPIRPIDILLPLTDERFSWTMFEQFCELFIKTVTGGEVHRYGKRGEKQKGIDFYVDLPDGKRWTYQCRRYKRFTVANARAAHAEKTYSRSVRHFVLVACEVGAIVRDQFDRWKRWKILDVRDLSNDVANLPLDPARRLLDTHFGASFRREFLGVHGVSTFLPLSAFFADTPSDLLSHNVALLGRQEVLDRIPEFLTGDQRVALLTGSGGIGKSRVLKAIGERAAATVAVRYVAPGIAVMPESADELPLAPLLLIVDDAHLRNDVDTLLEFVRQRELPTRVILAGRLYYGTIAEGILSLAGFSRSDLLQFDPHTPLKREETVALVQSLLPRARERDVQMLAKISRDAPLIAVVTCRLIQRRALDLSRLSRDEDVRFTVLERFRNERMGLIPDVDQDQARALTRLLTAIGPVNPDHPGIRAAMMEFLGLSQPALAELLDLLMDAGLVRQKGYVARVVPEVLAEHILDEACLTRQRKATGYAREVFRAFRGMAGARLLRNLAEVDWRNRSGAEATEDVFSEIFSEISNEFDLSGISGRLQILSIVQEIAYFEPKHALMMVQKALDASVRDAPVEDRHWRFSGGMLLGRLPEILRRVAYHPEHLARAARLLWELSRDATSAPGTKDGIQVLTELARWEDRKPLDYQLRLLDILASWLDQPDVHDHARSVLDIVDAALLRMSSETFMTGQDSFTWRSFLIPPDAQEAVRNGALTIVQHCSEHKDARVVLRAARIYVTLTKRLYPIATGQSITGEQQAWWKPERRMAFEELARIVTSIDEPLVQLEVVADLRSSLRYEKDIGMREAGLGVMVAVQDSDRLRITAALVDSRGHRYKSAEETTQEFERNWQKHLQAMRETAEWIVATYPAQEFVATAAERLAVAQRLDIRADPLVLLGQMGEVSPSFIKEVAAAMLELPDHPLAESLPTLIASVIAFDRDAGIGMARQAASSSVKAVALGATAAIPGERRMLSDEREIAEKLWLHPIPDVRACSIAMRSSFLKANSEFIAEVVPLIDLTETATAAAFAQAFNRQDLDISRLAPELVRKVIQDFRSLPSLSDHWVCDFIANAALTQPLEVIRMLLGRIADEEARDYDLDRQAIPHSMLHFSLETMRDNLDYWDALRLIRNTSINEVLRSWHLPELFVAFASVYDDRTLDVLDEWVASGEEKKLVAVAALVSEAPTDFVFDRKEWVIKVLNQAHTLGGDCYDQVASRLSTGAVTRMKHGNHGKPFPEDLELKEQALNAMKDLEPHTATWRFYDGLRRHGEREVQWKLARDAANEELDDV